MRFSPFLILPLLLITPALAQDDNPPVPRPRPAEAQSAPAATPSDASEASEAAQSQSAETETAEVGSPWLPPHGAFAPGGELVQGVAEPAVTPGGAPLPRARPDPRGVAGADEDADAEPTQAPEGEPATEQEAVAEAEPEVPPRIYQQACPALLNGLVAGEAVPPVNDGEQCGLQSPLSVTGVFANGRLVPFSGEATLTCGMATVLPGWVAAVDNYVKARENTEIESLIVGTSYMCRQVNNGSGSGNLSAHAFADALDVVGFTLADGRRVTILEGWPGTEEQGSRIVRYAHEAACSSFTTVLGPEANALHADHLHIDLLCHGRTCTARLCE